MINGFLSGFRYPAENFHFLWWVEDTNLSLFPRLCLTGSAQSEHTSLRLFHHYLHRKGFDKSTLGKYSAVHLFHMESFDGYSSRTWPQIPWAEMSVVGMGKDAEGQPGAHSRLSSVGQNQYWAEFHLRNSEPLRQEPGNQRFTLELICETGPGEVSLFLLLSLAKSISSTFHPKSIAHSPKCPPFPAAHRSPTQVWAAILTVGLREAETLGNNS